MGPGDSRSDIGRSAFLDCQVDAVRPSRLIFRYLFLLLLLSPAAPAGAQGLEGPRLLSVSPNPAPAGSVVRLEGQGLGSQVTGVLLLGGMPVQRQYVKSWSDTLVELRLPEGTRATDIAIHSGGLTSNTVWLEVGEAMSEPGPAPAAGDTMPTAPEPIVPVAAKPRPAAADLAAEMAPRVDGTSPEPSTRAEAQAPAAPPPSAWPGAPRASTSSGAPASARSEAHSSAPRATSLTGGALPFPTPGDSGDTGALAGKVQDAGGRPLSRAIVEIDGSPRTRTSGWGEFRVDGLAPGQHSISISLPGYRAGQGRVNIQAGQTRDLLVSLSPTSGRSAPSADRPPEERKTRLTIRVHPYMYDGQRYNVKRIEVTEQGGGGRTWQNTFYRVYDSYVELACEGAVIGRSCRVTVTWYSFRTKREFTSSWEPKVWKEYQQETYYAP